MKLNLKYLPAQFALLAVAAVAAFLVVIFGFIALLSAAGNLATLTVLVMYAGGLGPYIPTSPTGTLLFLFMPLGVLLMCFHLWEKQTGSFLEFIGMAYGMLFLLMFPIGIPGAITYIALKKTIWPDLSAWSVIPL